MTRAVSLDRGTVTVPLLMAAACAAGTLCVYIAAFHVTAVSDADLRLYFAFVAVVEPHSKLLNDFVGLVDPARFAVLAPVAPAIALLRRSPRLAAAAVAVIGGATLSTEVLKEITVAQRFAAKTDVISWPSGHATAATALALALVLVVPERWRAFTAGAGLLWVGGIATTILLLGRHVTSDVVAGMLIAGASAGLAIAALRLWPGPSPPNDDDGESLLLRPLAAFAGLLVLAGTITAALATAHDGLALDPDPVAITGSALLIAGIAGLVVGATAVCARATGPPAAVRGSGARARS
jgi:membrane-associated phospholipid phosphatase